MSLSIVSTLYNSATHVREFYERSVKVAAELFQDDFELILVNDGSPDESLEVALSLMESDPRLVVVDLSRNFGHHQALLTGLRYSKGDLVFLLDSDLEESPDYLSIFKKKLVDESCDVVYGVQSARKGNMWERLSGEFAYRLIDILSGIKHPRDITTARLMTRRYVDALLQYEERNVVISALWILAGFKQLPCEVVKHSKGYSSYNFTKKVVHLINSITSFSTVPLKVIFFIGFFIFATSIVYSLFLLCRFFVYQSPVPGYTSLIISVWLLGGLNAMFMGIVGVYVSKVYLETKNRPNVIVREVYRK